MAANYDVYIGDAFGNRLAEANNFYSLKYTRAANGVGALTIELPSSFNIMFIKKHGWIEVWRRVDDSPMRLDTETVWLITGYELNQDDSGASRITVKALSASWVLKTRKVLYDENTAYTRKVQAGDDMMKAIVRENLGSLALDTGRNLSSILAVQANTSAIPLVYKAFAGVNVLDVIQEIAESAYQAGFPLYYDIVYVSPSLLEFRTYSGQRGNDRRIGSGNPLLFGPDYGNIAANAYSVDWEHEITHVTAYGPGQENLHLIVQQSDPIRIGESPFGRVEEITNSQANNTLTSDAQTALRQNRPKHSFQGSIVNTAQARYGIEWNWGDYITAQDGKGRSFNGRIDAISIDLSGGQEKIDAMIKVEA